MPYRAIGKALGRHAGARFSSSSSQLPLLVSCAQARALLADPSVRFLDTRPELMFDDAHIPNAAHCFDIFSYLSTSDAVGVAKLRDTFTASLRKAGVSADTRVITYDVGYDLQYGASCRGWYILNLLGHRNVSVLDGGWAKWEADPENPTDDELDYDHPTGNFEAGWEPHFWANKADTLRIIRGEERGVILDVRDQDEWNAETSSPYGKDFAPRMGRFPNSIHINWRRFMDASGPGEEKRPTMLKGPEGVANLMAEAGITPEDNIVVLCFKGARASTVTLQLHRAGFQNIKNYFASWNEWSRDLQMPIEAPKMEKAG